MIDKLNFRKLKLSIILCFTLLIITWLLCLITGNYLTLSVSNPTLLKISAFIDSKLWLKAILKFGLYYLNSIIILYAILQKRILQYKSITISIYIVIIWMIKYLLSDYTFTNYLDFISILFVISIDKSKWKRAIVGNIILFITTLGSTAVKSFLGIQVQYLPFVLQSILMLDVYLICYQYYLYSLLKLKKEGEKYERFRMVLLAKEKVENFCYNLRNSISRCCRCFSNRAIIYDVYCSLIFFIITYGSILIVASILDRIIEITILIICFHIFRKKDYTTFHALTVSLCWLTSFISFSVMARITLTLAQSMFLQVSLAYVLTSIAFFVQYYLDTRTLKSSKPKYRERITKLLNNNLDEDYIDDYCIKHNISLKTSETVYLYLHNKLEDVSQILEIDNSTILRRVKNFINSTEL